MMKTILTSFAAGAVCSAAIVFFATQDDGARQDEQVAENPQSRKSSARSPRRDASRASDADAPRSRTSAARTDKKMEDAPKVTQLNNEEREEMYNKAMERMVAAGKERQEKRIAAKLASLTKTLNLTDAQATKMEALLREQAKRSGGGGWERLLGQASDVKAFTVGPDGTGSGRAITLDPSQLRKIQQDDDEFDFDAGVREILDGNQTADYDQYLDNRRNNHVEASANSQLSKLQRTIPDLSDEQKDRAYEEFARISREHADKYGVPEGNSQNFDFRRMRRQARAEREALKNILTPEQQEVYKNDSRGVNNAVVIPGGSISIPSLGGSAGGDSEKK